MPPEPVYIVEDDANIAQLVQYNLDSAGFNAVVFERGDEAADAILRRKPSLVILDLMLPGKDGIEVLKLIRINAETRAVPVIILTAKGEEFDRILGLELGADDYISKPFSVRELVARVKAVLRRSENTSGERPGSLVMEGPVTLDAERHRVYLNGIEVELTLKEFELLKCLMLSSGKVVRRDTLLDNIWGYDSAIETRTVDVHIRRLRQLIGEERIETVRGVGYRFNTKA